VSRLHVRVASAWSHRALRWELAAPWGSSLVVLLASLAVLASTRPANACSCIAIDPRAAYAHDGLVALLKVTGLDATPAQGPWNVTLLSLKVWKGSWRPDMTLQVQTPGPRGPCGIFIHVGDEFLVYSQDPDTLTLIFLCNTVWGNDVPAQAKELDAVSGHAK
jgi:hypothetical protein